MFKKIKILQAIRQGKVGGGETHVLDLVNSLDPERFESVILSFTEGPMVDRLKADGFKTYVIPTERPFNYRVWNKVKEIAYTEKIDIIHAHGTRANSNTFACAKSLKIPLIYTVHGWSFHPDQNILIKFIRSLSERFLVKISDKVICVSQSNFEEGKRKFPMENAVVILNGIDQVKFDPYRSHDDIRTEFGLGNENILVGYMARLTHQKAPLVFIQAIGLLKSFSHVKFLVVGEGELKNEMEALVHSLQLEDTVIFSNFRNDVPAILNAIDIFCLPSLWEGLPIALLEAMAMKKAVVASSIDGITDLIIDKENGILVQPLDVKSLARAIGELIIDRKLRLQLGTRAKDTVKERFNVNLMARKVEMIYNEFT